MACALSVVMGMEKRVQTAVSTADEWSLMTA